MVPRNELGGVLVTEEDVDAAFRFLDVKGNGKLSIQGLKQRFGVFGDSLPVAKIRHMMDGKTSITLDALKALVMDNAVTDYDPVAEAFKARHE
jgi:calmodulin